MYCRDRTWKLQDMLFVPYNPGIKEGKYDPGICHVLSLETGKASGHVIF